MAALVDRIAFAVAVAGCVAPASCGDLQGLGDEPLTPLGNIPVRGTGDRGQVRPPDPRPPRLRAALLWGQPTLPDASCVPPVENPDHAAVVALGCDDPLGFERGSFETEVDAAVNADGTATLDL